MVPNRTNFLFSVSRFCVHKTFSYLHHLVSSSIDMSKFREIVNDSKQTPSDVSKWLHWTKITSLNIFNGGLSWGLWGYGMARHLGWFVVTTGMITALPLIFEIRREAIMDAEEMQAISAGIAEGKTPQELAMAGLSAAIEPKVL